LLPLQDTHGDRGRCPRPISAEEWERIVALGIFDEDERELRLSARAGVPEYRVVNVDDEWIEVYRSPAGDAYREVHRTGRGERIAPLDVGDVTIDVGDAFA
jgi:hypothetical protein